ncbi:hypothetical protein ND6B_1423 [Pseudoalteromonas sp. ND6B]|nr:hypothetical protein ND6B_1423 [Pseudoalteromonas sp. ND6B]
MNLRLDIKILKLWPKLVDHYTGGEIQLTDAIDALLAIDTVEAFHMSGRSHDCGDKLGYLKAIVEYSMRDKSLGDEFTEHMKELVKG